MFRADLHCHTTCSDGTLSPVELVNLAHESGLSGLSITDHDTLDAYETAIPAAKEKGIILGTGIEFSCLFLQKSVHILGYDYSLKSEEIRKFCLSHQKRRIERNRAILEKLRRLRMPIEESELGGKGTIGRPHIAQIMVQKGFVGSIKEAFNIYIGDGKCCYDAGTGFSAEETIDLIHKAQGKAFLAHPHLLDHGRWVQKLLQLPFDGVECHYSRLPAEKEKRWLRLAKEKGWLISGGSDFHGDVKPQIPLGCSWVDQETFNKIFSESKN